MTTFYETSLIVCSCSQCLSNQCRIPQSNNVTMKTLLKTQLRLWFRGHQRGARGHQVARKEYISRPRARSKNNISMINVFTLTNINTKITEGKLSKMFISLVCVKLVALRINRYTRSSSQFQKGWWSLLWFLAIFFASFHSLP